MNLILFYILIFISNNSIKEEPEEEEDIFDGRYRFGKVDSKRLEYFKLLRFFVY